MTKLTKPVYRTVILDGEEYIASIEPRHGKRPPAFGLRKKRARDTHRADIASLLTGTGGVEEGTAVLAEKEEKLVETQRINRPTHTRSMQDAFHGRA